MPIWPSNAGGDPGLVHGEREGLKAWLGAELGEAFARAA
jgi:hypothetical protein